MGLSGNVTRHVTLSFRALQLTQAKVVLVPGVRLRLRLKGRSLGVLLSPMVIISWRIIV